MGKNLCFASILLIVAGCSSFDRDFKAAVERGGTNGIEGAWDGQWKSKGGHGGDRLRALVTRPSPDVCHTRFRAKYWGIFEVDETVDLHVTGTSPVRASGEADLGWLKGGAYRYDATIT